MPFAALQSDDELFSSETELDDRLSEPTPAVIETLAVRRGGFLVLGASGKMGPSLARMIRRALDAAGSRDRVIGVARFSSGGEARLQSHGVETIRCDLLEDGALTALPDALQVIYMTGMKFGSTGNEAATWAMNSFLPGLVCQRFRNSKIVAFSTGNVYGLTATACGGSREDDSPRPVGEYAQSCLGRERMFEHFSRTLNIPLALIRLNYACDLRYGVLVDLAGRVWRNEPIDLSMGHFNTIWQGDANALTLQAFGKVSSPPWIVNITGPELLSVRDVCEHFGRRWNKPVRLIGEESSNALISNSQKCCEVLGQPYVTAAALIDWVADWVERGGRQLGKPTHFESREGRF